MDPVREAQIGAVRAGDVPLAPEELASILRSVADGITAQGPDGRLVFANDAAAQLCGLESSDELLHLSGPELLRAVRDHRRGRRADAGRQAAEPARLRRALAAGRRPRLSHSSERRRALVGPPLDAASGRRGRGAPRDQRLPRHHRRAERRGADPLPGRGEHAPLRLARLRGDARRPRAPARPADRRLLHRGHDRRGRSKPSAGRDLAPESRARRAAPRAAAALPAGGERGASGVGGARERRAAPVRGCAGRGARARGRRRGASRALSRARRDVLHRRAAPGARPAARDDLARDRGVRAALREDRSRARARDRAARGARDRQRASLRSRAGVVRAARHAARVGAGGNRLLGSRAPLRARERRARGGQPQDAGGARRPDARGGDPDARAGAAAALPAGTRVGRAARPHRVDRRRCADHRRAASLALQLLPGAHRRGRGDRRRRGDHGDHRSPARGRSAAPARGGRGALLELARPRRDRGADRAGDRAAARRLLQRLRGLGRLARTRCLREQRSRSCSRTSSRCRPGIRSPARAQDCSRTPFARPSPSCSARSNRRTSRSSSASAPTRSTSSRSAPAR